MKNKYWIGILYVCIFISAAGCSTDVNANVQSENIGKTADALSEHHPGEYTEGCSYYEEPAVSESVPERESEKELEKESEKELEQESEKKLEKEPKKESEREEYSNPIDAYFLPHIENASCEAERRELQDTYRGVWKTEFEHIMVWMQDKCVYQEDKDNLLLYTKSVESLIDTTRTILVTDWLDDYRRSPGSDSRNAWGTGTRSGLNQKEAEIYRDAAMKLIDDTYVFEERDYSLEHYE